MMAPNRWPMVVAEVGPLMVLWILAFTFRIKARTRELKTGMGSPNHE